MSKPRVRGISLVRSIRISKPDRKEGDTVIRKQFRVWCNAAIPPSHKNFQNQYLPEDEVIELPPTNPAPKKKSEKKSKVSKFKNKYV